MSIGSRSYLGRAGWTFQTVILRECSFQSTFIENSFIYYWKCFIHLAEGKIMGFPWKLRGSGHMYILAPQVLTGVAPSLHIINMSPLVTKRNSFQKETFTHWGCTFFKCFFFFALCHDQVFDKDSFVIFHSILNVQKVFHSFLFICKISFFEDRLPNSRCHVFFFFLFFCHHSLWYACYIYVIFTMSFIMEVGTHYKSTNITIVRSLNV